MAQHTSIEQRIAEAARRWPHIQFKRKTSDEASSPCPFCNLADTDGFLIFANAGYWCRKCGAKGWIDDDNPKLPSAQEQLAIRVKQLERQQQEHERRLTALEQMARCTDHLTYHNEMPDSAREYWMREGMTDATIQRYLLGYCNECPTCRESASYTIPVINNERLENIRHRLKSPAGGKYRPHLAGLGNSLFGADILKDTERVLIVEGAKKAIVLMQSGFPTVAVMGKSAFKKEWLPWFDNVPAVYIALDPDARESAWKLGRGLAKHGIRGVRVATFPVKPDDMIVQHGAGADDIEAVLRGARPVD